MYILQWHCFASPVALHFDTHLAFGSNLLQILSKPSFTLEELMLEEDFLQEVAGRNVKLIQLYVCTVSAPLHRV